MSGLSELYQNVILEHNRSPRNYRVLEDANRRVEGNNPLCGDRLTLWLKVEDGVIRDLGFQGSGCAISRASASLMTAAVKGKTEAEAGELFDRFHQLVTGTLDPAQSETLGKLAVFSGVSEFPVRVKCATLPWHALKRAMGEQGSAAS
ncbi:MAG TPA: SUF system NifU family Fe-S cluster assembly protein [Gemmatimonadales bacterium]|nr:SUF system NifU family Fe-S cluster assembly protein [Gemmatimonadales bacterium]